MPASQEERGIVMGDVMVPQSLVLSQPAANHSRLVFHRLTPLGDLGTVNLSNTAYAWFRFIVAAETVWNPSRSVLRLHMQFPDPGATVHHEWIMVACPA